MPGDDGLRRCRQLCSSTVPAGTSVCAPWSSLAAQRPPSGRLQGRQPGGRRRRRRRCVRVPQGAAQLPGGCGQVLLAAAADCVQQRLRGQ